MLVRSVAGAALVRSMSDASGHMGRGCVDRGKPGASGAVSKTFGASAVEWDDRQTDGGLGGA